ncbi:DUF1697 domain-containing protein [Phyllobacterium sophorae]|jgi:uncharacterized protein (DUF1697 family)|uniref:DUF1697 domain-containing protein n=1 Tax=Phyllobacterium sophorae TaxID=1520277 RepID=A0A2P7BIA7_9HYPH|nr:DUF1697 domain-containing protein [Phyllobacterium sophorae]PSH66206.1 hypothetical protein CU103_06415 [Phyllobacterium sophorae]
MATYIVLFRGVGGATLLPVQPLKTALIEGGFERVATYINTGNVVLISDARPKVIVQRIAAIALEKFAFSKAIMILSKPQWKKLIADNPFPEHAGEGDKLHAFLMEKKPDDEAVKALERKAIGLPEQFRIGGKVLYYYPPQGASQSKLHGKIESTLRVTTTARNWNTVLKLEQLADKLEKTS